MTLYLIVMQSILLSFLWALVFVGMSICNGAQPVRFIDATAGYCVIALMLIGLKHVI